MAGHYAGVGQPQWKMWAMRVRSVAQALIQDIVYLVGQSGMQA